MNLNPLTAALKRLAKWLAPHLREELEKEAQRRLAPHERPVLHEPPDKTL